MKIYRTPIHDVVLYKMPTMSEDEKADFIKRMRQFFEDLLIHAIQQATPHLFVAVKEDEKELQDIIVNYKQGVSEAELWEFHAVPFDICIGNKLLFPSSPKIK